MYQQIALAALSIAAAVTISPAGEHDAIERAVLDYAEAYYEVRLDYVERSIHPDLVKVGYELKPDGEYATHPMDYEGFGNMVRWYEMEGKKPDAGPKRVEILDAMDQTALVKLTGSWGTDYMQLAKFDGKWKTRHAIWQSAPTERSDELRKADRKAVEAAVRGYLEAIYLVEPKRIETCVDPELAKYGFWREGDAGEYSGSLMSREELMAGAAKWYAEGAPPADAPRKIEVLDVMNRVACVKLTAQWGVDYMNLAKKDGRWMIMHVLWQSHPPEQTAQ